MVATPIGNLLDITLRALETLKKASAIAAEDTRVTARLLSHYGLSTPLFSIRQEARGAQAIIHRLAAGEKVALVSDAGTPLLSDPGARIVQEVRQAGFAVVPIPGPSSLTSALCVSGAEGPFLFLGFLPARPAARQKLLQEVAALPYALVCYEAPHRIAQSLEDLAAFLGGERKLAFCRELTKVHETVRVLTVGELRAWIREDSDQQRGEMVLVIHPPSGEGLEKKREKEMEKILSTLLRELSLSRAVEVCALVTSLPKNKIYEKALFLERHGR